MSDYLIVAYQTAGGQPLRDAIGRLIEEDPEATFRLLVPATRTQHLFTWTEGEAKAVATKTANVVAQRLRDSGVRLTDIIVGNPDPFLAATTELEARPGIGGILVSTFPPGISRWLRSDLPSRLEKATGLPVTHVVVEPEQSRSS